MEDEKKLENEKKGLSFTISESQIQEEFLNYLLKTEDIPPDASVAAKITKIEKQYRLFTKCSGPYIARWKATCIWERREEYTYEEDKIVFIDKYGSEFNYRVDGSTPIAKRVQKTGYRTVIDKVEPKNETIKKEYSALVPADGIETPLSNWISEKFCQYETDSTTLSDDELSGCIIVDPKREIKAILLADANCKSSCLSYVKTIIPGNRYKDFTFDFTSFFKANGDYYIPVYRVEYTYNNSQYEVWFSGCEKGVWFSDNSPISSKTISHKKASKRLYTLSVIFTIVDVLILIIAAFFSSEFSLEFMDIMIYAAIAVFCVLIGCLIAGRIFQKSSSTLPKQWIDVKKRLSEICNNQEMTLQDRKLKMEQLVKELGAEDAKVSRNRKKRAIIFLVAILVVIASIFLAKQVIIPMKNYSKAEKLFASGQYSEAAKAFQDLGNFKDSEEKFIDVVAASSKEVVRQTHIGSGITIGDYHAVVLDKESDRVLIMLLGYIGSDYTRRFNVVCDEIYDYGSPDWESSSLRAFLNNDFLDEFHEGFKRLVLEVDLQNITQSGEDLGMTRDKVFLLSAVSDKRYIDAIINNGTIITSTTFTRTPADSERVVSIDITYTDGVGYHSSMGTQEIYYPCYIYPCLWLDIS